MMERIASIACAAACITAFAWLHYRGYEHALLLQQFSDAGIDIVEVNPGTTVPVSVLSVGDMKRAWYQEVNRIEPIFALPDTDLTALRESLDSFTAYKGTLASLYEGEERRLVENTLYPEQFLSLLPSLEAARAAMLEDPSTHAVREYHELLMRALVQYRRAAERLSRALRASDTGSSFGFLGGLSDASTLATGLESVREQASSQQDKALRRIACMRAFTASCESLRELIEARAASFVMLQQQPQPDAAVRAVDADLQELNRSFETYADIHSPLFAIHSACQPYEPTYVRVWWRKGDNGLIRKLSIANDIYVYDLQEPALPNLTPEQARNLGIATGFNRILQERGVRLMYQIPGSFYMCPEAGRDEHAISALLALRTALQQPVVAASVDSDIATLESLVRDTEVLSEYDARAYIRSIDAFAQAHTRSDIDATLGAGAWLRIEHILAGYRLGSYKTDELVRAAEFEMYYSIAMGATGKPMPLWTLFLSRSLISLLYFPDNPSFAPSGIALFSQRESFPLSRFGIDSYRVLVRTQGKAAVFSDLSNGSRLQEEVVREVAHQAQVELGATAGKQ